MPIVDIEIVVSPQETLPQTLASALANAIGEFLGTPSGRTWVRLRTLSSAMYAEQGSNAGHVQPVFVTVLKAERPSESRLRHEITGLTRIIAKSSGRSADHVHVIYDAEARGRVAFGGRLVE